jgi:exodeoxyribonuclease V alpha subunit
LRGDERVYLQDGRTLLLRELPGFEPAFALSAHKSQGSEYEEVLCWLPPGSEEFGREALYTALTRAKRSVRIAAGKETVERMLAIGSRQENGLKERAAR